MKVKDLLKILNQFDVDSKVLIQDRKTGIVKQLSWSWTRGDKELILESVEDDKK